MMMPGPRATGYLVATMGVGAATTVLWVLHSHLGNAHIGLLYLLVVAAAAARGGTRPGLVASVLGFLCWDFFFLPPVFTFAVHDPRDWLLLLVFLCIGVLVGNTTGRVRLRENQARDREEETAALYRTSQTLNLHSRPGTALPFVLEQIAQAVRVRALAVLRNVEGGNLETLAVCGEPARVQSTGVQQMARWVLREARAVGLRHPLPHEQREDDAWPVSVTAHEVTGGEEDRGEILVPLATRRRVFGVLVAVPETGGSIDMPSQRLLVAFSAQMASFLDRELLQQEAAALASRQEMERLRGVLFSSLSHNLKTPLASLNATLSGMRGDDVEWDADLMRESLGLMDEDVKRLTLHIENLLNLARLESGTWQPQREWFEVRELVDVALRLLPVAERRRVRVGSMPEAGLTVDSVQLGQVIRHLVENALAYSPAESRVYIEATSGSDGVRIDVGDEGAGVPEKERGLIFDKFFRGEVARKQAVRGTGLGLSICREILNAHGGRIEVGASEHGGARFTIVLPAG